MKITLDIPDEYVRNAVIAGVHGGRYGIGYWARASGLYTDLRITEHMDTRDELQHVHHTLTPAKLRRACALLAMECPSMFARLVANNPDGPLGDNLIQLAIFGELKYG